VSLAAAGGAEKEARAHGALFAEARVCARRNFQRALAAGGEASGSGLRVQQTFLLQ
jgi:hypothetical protein